VGNACAKGKGPREHTLTNATRHARRHENAFILTTLSFRTSRAPRYSRSKVRECVYVQNKSVGISILDRWRHTFRTIGKDGKYFITKDIIWTVLKPLSSKGRRGRTSFRKHSLAIWFVHKWLPGLPSSLSSCTLTPLIHRAYRRHIHMRQRQFTAFKCLDHLQEVTDTH
jgi:hypothetical protein